MPSANLVIPYHTLGRQPRYFNIVVYHAAYSLGSGGYSSPRCPGRSTLMQLGHSDAVQDDISTSSPVALRNRQALDIVAAGSAGQATLGKQPSLTQTVARRRAALVSAGDCVAAQIQDRGVKGVV